jgi:hypothetical protein
MNFAIFGIGSMATGREYGYGFYSWNTPKRWMGC